MNKLESITRTIYKYLQNLKNKQKIQFISMLIFFLLCMIEPIFFPMGYTFRLSLYGVLLIIAVLTGFEKINEGKTYKFGKFYLTLIGMMTIGSIITAVYVRSVGYLAFGIYFLIFGLIIIPALDSINIKSSMKNVIYASVAIYLLHLFIALIAMPISAYQYTGLISDPNGLSLFSLLIICGLLYLSKQEEYSSLKSKTTIYLIISTALSFIIFSKSRQAILCLIGIVVVELANDISKKRKKHKRHLLVALVSFAVVLPSMFYFMKYVTPNISKFTAPMMGSNYKEFYNKMTNNQSENVQEENNLEEAVRGMYTRSMKGINDDDNFSSGRIGIWKDYLNEVTVLGHKQERIYSNSYKIVISPHNSLIQIWYSLGFLPFISLLIIYLYCIGWEIKSLINIKNIDFVAIFAMEIIGINLLSNNLSSQYHIFSHFLSALFYLSALYLIYKKALSIKVSNPKNKVKTNK